MKPAGASSTEKPQQKRNKTEKNKKDCSSNTIQTKKGHHQQRKRMKQPFKDHTEKQILRTAQKTKETKPARAGRQPPNWRLMLHVIFWCKYPLSYFILSIYLANMGK